LNFFSSVWLLHRPHPNECSGSDLDGDLYFVSWDPELIPPNTYEPMDYTAEEPQALDHEVTIQVRRVKSSYCYRKFIIC